MKHVQTTFTWFTNILIIPLLIISCSDNTTSSNSEIINSDWIIPQNEVVDGGPGKDGIPSIDDPQFSIASDITYVDENRLVTGIKVGDTIKAYPHQVMDHHEIVNDGIGDIPYCMSYCPLTGTAIAWERTIDGETVEYGVSGMLFRNNLIPYDRKTESRYSQMQMRGVNGEESGNNLELLQIVQTIWSTWKNMYPNSQVLTTDTGFNRNYSGFAYGSGYLEEDSGPLFPRKFQDDRLPAKKRVHGVIEEGNANQNTQVKVYVIDEFGSGINLQIDQFVSNEIIVAGSTDLQFAVSFRTVIDENTVLSFEPVQNDLPVIMKDQEGNRWDLFGYAVEGPRQGERLTATLSYTGYWFAWADFFPGLKIYSN
jgi:hypothetical protein